MRRTALRKAEAADESSSPSPLHQLLPTSRLVTVAEVATALAVSVKTISRLIKAGQLPVYRIGSATRIRSQDVIALLGHATPGETSANLHNFIHHQLTGGSHGPA